MRPGSHTRVTCSPVPRADARERACGTWRGRVALTRLRCASSPSDAAQSAQAGPSTASLVLGAMGKTASALLAGDHQRADLAVVFVGSQVRRTVRGLGRAARPGARMTKISMPRRAGGRVGAPASQGAGADEAAERPARRGRLLAGAALPQAAGSCHRHTRCRQGDASAAPHDTLFFVASFSPAARRAARCCRSSGKSCRPATLASRCAAAPASLEEQRCTACCSLTLTLHCAAQAVGCDGAVTEDLAGEVARAVESDRGLQALLVCASTTSLQSSSVALQAEVDQLQAVQAAALRAAGADKHVVFVYANQPFAASRALQARRRMQSTSNVTFSGFGPYTECGPMCIVSPSGAGRARLYRYHRHPRRGSSHEMGSSQGVPPRATVPVRPQTQVAWLQGIIAALFLGFATCSGALLWSSSRQVQQLASLRGTEACQGRREPGRATTPLGAVRRGVRASCLRRPGVPVPAQRAHPLRVCQGQPQRQLLSS